jgi:hypothetical protein
MGSLEHALEHMQATMIGCHQHPAHSCWTLGLPLLAIDLQLWRLQQLCSRGPPLLLLPLADLSPVRCVLAGLVVIFC